MPILTERDAKRAIRLLGLLQDHLESAIESTLLPGETVPSALIDRAPVALDRRHWREAEDLVEKLSHETRRRAKR